MYDRSEVSTETAYKCARCGNEYPVTQAACEVCGFACDEAHCQIVEVSKEGF